ncbi:citrate synthase [Epibacterium sp. SM1979]|uniref:citrate synthase (unknown stereospecificity) n=1 Tax=Tritonibacter litoralis TaxID=2662264 RepID=A0A843YLZ2_9RHOB|nr:citrate synthase [Tritonibacter litoralis]MQQ10665.1 citrate synthase [Tritonibacter litoralis]
MINTINMKKQPKPSLKPSELVSAKEACATAGISAATLYAYVSRGLVRTYPDPDDARRSRYDAHDVDALVARKKRPRTRSEIARSTIEWGEPILRSAVSQIRDGRLYYRKRDATTLAGTESFETVTSLLTGTGLDFDRSSAHPTHTPSSHPLDTIMMALVKEAAKTSGRDGPRRGARLINQVIAAGSGVAARKDEPVHTQVARGLGAKPSEQDIIRRALILCADHELNPSCYAARVAASTGANLAASLLAGIAAFSGPRHGRMPDLCAAWLDSPDEPRLKTPEQSVPPGFEHRLYPQGDIRALDLLKECPAPEDWQKKADMVLQQTGAHPNVTFALACMERRLNLSKGASCALFAIGRSVGWVAHVLEQRKVGPKIRPRAFI